ncbi:NADP-dependent oxidoreductase [Nocardia yamanashiensis]|uniref:NADP-dependent oxidoreductase n=1 Tax=Nocardia yamanashiensis TaxID=209247 RepID=UPI001E3D547D|nr:NADP-dependent oxidoreductase [Nocardia yamanashiensis]UGT40607.1 NADP-dependent oxidoreductase [Nocardia yamanashiensis]
MKAISQHSVGGPDVLETVELPVPRPAPGEVLVRVAATSVNAADWKLRAGLIDKLGAPPFTLGFDVSGVVSEPGPGVTGFAAGDEVYGMVLGRSGAYAEYVVAQADHLAPKPRTLTHTAAAALPTAALTAWQELAELTAGQRILVHAAAGGVGHLAVQLAKARGAHVIATARAVNHDFLSGLGADELIDYTTTPFDSILTDLDVVFDLVGGDYAPRSLTVLRPDGRLIDAQGEEPLDDPRYFRHYVTPSGADLREIAALADAGRLRPAVTRVFPLSEVAAAHELGESGRVRGKLVLVPWAA